MNFKQYDTLLTTESNMCADIPINKRTYYNRKTIPQTGRIRKQTDTVVRIEDASINDYDLDHGSNCI